MEPISSVLFTLFRNRPGHSDWIVACLEGAWQGLVGASLSRVCRPGRLRDFTLVIEVDADWENALRSCEELLLSRIRRATAGEVRAITFTTTAGTR